jgi:hypothetical protein
MRTLFKLSTLTAAILLAAATVAEAGGGAYMGGGGGGGRGMSMGGGGGRGMSAGGGGMSAPSSGWSGGGGSRNASPNHGGGNGTGNWHGNNGNWHGGHGHGHGYWYGGWYYPYWWWPAWGATIAVGAWPYWSGTWVDPYYYPAQPQTYYYGGPSGTIVYRDGPPAAQGQGGVAPPSQPFRMYCPATNQYYPDVSECAQQWLKVLPNDGAAPSMPQSGPQPMPQSQPMPQTRNVPQYVPTRATSTTTASLAVATPLRETGAVKVGSSSYGTKIAAPRMDLPGARAGNSIVAEVSAQ